MENGESKSLRQACFKSFSLRMAFSTGMRQSMPREILDADAAIGFRMVEVVALILEDSSFGENGKAMGKASGDEELRALSGEL